LKLLVATDAYFYRTPDGAVYCNALYGYGYFQRFLSVFDAVRVVARQKDVDTVPETWLRVDGEGVETFGIPYYRGPKQLLPKYFKIHVRLRHAADGCDAAMLRVPGQTAHMTFDHLPKGMPVAAEAVSDFTGFIEDPRIGFVSKTLYRMMSAKLARICKQANGVAYVTREAIQKHYPSHAMLHGETETYFDQYCSDIDLDDADFAAPRSFVGQTTFTLIHTDAAMNAERKGERVVLQAIARLRKQGFDVRGVFVGDGVLRGSFEAQAKELGIWDAVHFTGVLSTHEEVMRALNNADIYVLPSHAEGLSRGIVEAMVSGLPCLSTPVGGTPELLPAECLAAPEDVDAFTSILANWIATPEILERLSRENIEMTQQFRRDVLMKKREAFYGKLRALAEKRREEK